MRPQSMSRPTPRVVLLALLFVGGVATAWLIGVPHMAAPAGVVRVPWWLLTAMVALTEVVVFHVQIRREAKTVSAGEIPLVAGLFLADPISLLLARVVGGLVVFVGFRRQTPLKIGFNAALLAADTTLALAVFQVLSSDGHVADVQTWFAAATAAAAAATLDALALSCVIGWYDGRLQLSAMLKHVSFSARTAALVAVVGLIPVHALAVGYAAVVPLAAAGVVLLLGYRAYASLADRHTSLERIYHFSEAVSSAIETGSVLRSVLSESLELLRAERAELVHVFDASGNAMRWTATATEGHHTIADPESLQLSGVAARVVETGRSQLLRRGEGYDEGFLAERDGSEAVLVPLRVEGGVVGMLAVIDRMGEVRGFERDDVPLLETVANHAAVALQHGHLIERLRHEALHDELTSLPNRAYFMQLAQQHVELVSGNGGHVAAMIMDLDGFKSVNDTLGHQVGDQLLVAVAERLRAAGGDGVTVARLGGDEFAVLAEHSDAETAMGIAHRLLDSLEEPVPVGLDKLQLAASVGVAVMPDHATDTSVLLKRADIAMYAAKQATGGARLYRPDLDDTGSLFLPLATELRKALGDGRVVIEVQPLMQVDTGALHSVEVLARWHHPDLGTLSPATFLPLAERNGLIAPLTLATLDQALAGCAQWRARGHDIGVAVNLSARTLADPELPRMVDSSLARHGVPAELLTLEITESSVISDPDRALGLLNELREQGVRLSMDDFGTGYSSLTYLTQLPVHQIKIDRSFVQGLAGSERHLAIVRSIIDLGGSLQLEVVGEGVEDELTLHRLGDLGCRVVQGYHVARPMPPRQLQPWLERRLAASAA